MFTTIIILLSLILIHEAGHYRAAKRSGVKIWEFGIGIPPKIAQIRKNKSGTSFTINAIPLGGFVRLKGESIEDPLSQDSDSLIKASLIKKTRIILGGIIANLLFAFIVMTTLFTQGIQPITVIDDNTLPQRFNSRTMPSLSYAKEINLLQKRNIAEVNSKENKEEQGQKRALTKAKTNIINAAGRSLHEIYIQSRLTFYVLGDIIKSLSTGTKEEKQKAIESVGGPVAAVATGKQIAQHRSPSHMRLYAAMISIALAIFNLLPIPALDGGRLLSFYIQKITKIGAKKYFTREQRINTIFFLLLLILGILIILKDIRQFF